jgi:hypothetical protein
MFSTLILVVLRIFSQRWRTENAAVSRKYYTSSTNAVNVLLGSHKYKIWSVAALHGVPMYIALASLLYLNRGAITHSWITVGFVYLAVFWSWLGPALMWRYETTITDLLIGRLRQAVSEEDFNRLEILMRRKVIFHPFLYVFFALWVGYIVYLVMESDSFIQGFGITPRSTDLWWYAVLIGAAIFAVHTGILGVFVFREWYFIYILYKSRIQIDPYSRDRTGGFGFIGNYITQTMMLFSTGLLFVPLFIMLGAEGHHYLDQDYKVLAVFALFSGGMVTAIAIPVYFMHRKLAREKRSIADRIRGEIAGYFSPGQAHIVGGNMTNYIWRRSYLVDVERMNDWPYNLRNALSMVGPVVGPIGIVVTRMYFK